METKQITYFVSGHRDVTEEEFNEHYRPLIDRALFNPNAMFIMGDYHGLDAMAQKYLKENEADCKGRVIIFHMFSEPRNNAGFPTIGGFQTDEERDSAMTDASDYDIAWVREGKENSGTAQNLMRRMHPAGTYVKDMSGRKRK